MSISSPPSWVKDAVFYQIFPDRFARSSRVSKPAYLEPWDSTPTVHGYKGGDLLGVSERLDTLQELGVNALYFTPVFQSASNHRYHTHDYYRVDPMLGGDKALFELIDKVHERGMRIVLDGVFNHASRGFFQFSDILENGKHSAYRDWFQVRRFPLNAYGEGPLGYDAWWNLPALPKFNTETAAVRDFLWGVGEYWLRAGVDGWRLDVPNEIDDDSFWQEFRRRCRQVNPECYLVGEIWGEGDRWLQGDQFDAVMNYPFTRAALGFVARTLDRGEVAKCGYVEIEQLDAAGFAREATSLLGRHRTEVTLSQLNLIGSHDTPRALSVLCDDRQALKMAFLLLLTFPGAPCIYYGDEIGLSGGHDPYCRGTIPWPGNEPAVTDPARTWDEDLRDYVAHLAKLRHQHEALRSPELRVLHAQDDLLLFARGDGSASALVAVNRGEKKVSLDLTVERSRVGDLSGEFHDPLSGLRLSVGDGQISGFDIPPRRGSLFVPAN